LRSAGADEDKARAAATAVAGESHKKFVESFDVERCF
jgi:hypothetical protein